MSVPLFKDFSKETSDLLSKFHMAPGAWKVESKLKGGNDTVFVNPTATNEGVSADVEYKSTAQPVAVKVNLVPSGIKKVTTTIDKSGHKVEVVTALKDNKFDAVELTHEHKCGKLAINDKLSKKALEIFTSFKATDFIFLGAGATYGFNNKALSYQIRARFAQKGGITADVATSDLKSFAAGVNYPLVIAGKKVSTAAQASYNVDKKDLTITTGAELNCIVFPKNSLRFKVDNKKSASVAYIARLPGWTAAVSATQKCQLGLNLILE